MIKLLFRIIVSCIVLACAAARVGYVVVRGDGFRPATPGRLETRVARYARRVAIPADDRQPTNPEPQDAAGLRAGLELFPDHCAVMGEGLRTGVMLTPRRP